MRRLQWSTRAHREFKKHLAEWTEADPQLAAEAQQEFDAGLDLLTRYPGIGRTSRRWQAYKEKSFGRWKKIVVYRATDDFIFVHAILDMRQDLDRVQL